MKVTKLKEGVYRIKDSKGIFIVKGGFSTDNKKWIAFDCETLDKCSDKNNWGVSFDTFKQLKQFAKNN